MLGWRSLARAVAIIVAVYACTSLLMGSGPQSAEDAKPSADDASQPFTPSAEFQEWITRLVREQLPDQYEKKKNWGHTAKSFDGVSVRMENGRLKTHRKFKEANDGAWQ